MSLSIPMDSIEYTKEFIDSIENRHEYKIIILVIASHNYHYDHFKNCWQKYMNMFPDVRSFFLYSNPNIDYDIIVDNDSITYKYEEWYEPGILYKTIAGMNICDKNFDYSYLLRTNLSSFIHIPRLVTFLENQPTTNYVAAKQNIFREGIGFISGAGFIISNDITKNILKEIIIENCITEEIRLQPDDVAITNIIKRFHNNYFDTLERYDCESLIDVNSIDEKIFHIRNKTEWIFNHREIDMKNYTTLMQHFYNL